MMWRNLYPRQSVPCACIRGLTVLMCLPFGSPVSGCRFVDGCDGHVSIAWSVLELSSATYVGDGVGRATAFGSGSPGFGYEGFTPSSQISISQVYRVLALEVGGTVVSHIHGSVDFVDVNKCIIFAACR